MAAGLKAVPKPKIIVSTKEAIALPSMQNFRHAGSRCFYLLHSHADDSHAILVGNPKLLMPWEVELKEPMKVQNRMNKAYYKVEQGSVEYFFKVGARIKGTERGLLGVDKDLTAVRLLELVRADVREYIIIEGNYKISIETGVNGGLAEVWAERRMVGEAPAAFWG